MTAKPTDIELQQLKTALYTRADKMTESANASETTAKDRSLAMRERQDAVVGSTIYRLLAVTLRQLIVSIEVMPTGAAEERVKQVVRDSINAATALIISDVEQADALEDFVLSPESEV